MSSTPIHPDGLLSSAKQHWRALLPAWLSPAFLFLVQFLPWFDSHPFLVLVLVIAPVMVYCFRRAAEPLRVGRISRAQYAFWVLLVPFLIWIAIVSGIWAALV